MMSDMTYCVPHEPCPLEDCIRHYSKLEDLRKQGQKYVSIADFAPTCRRYIHCVLEEVENER